MLKLRNLARNQTLNETLLTLLILTFPFGSAYLSFSIGFMTIYPSFVILIALVFMGLIRRDLPGTAIEKYYLGFLLLFILVSIAHLPFVQGRGHALVDIRSVVLMLFMGYAFLSQGKFLGFEKWRITLRFAFTVVYILVCAVGLLEYLLGWHFAGSTTEHIIERRIWDMVVYSPIFLWDNPNNFLLYIILFGFILILLEPSGRKRNILFFIVTGLNLFFTAATMSRVGMMICVFSIIVCSSMMIVENLRALKNKSKSGVYFVLFVIVSFAIVVVSKEKFYGLSGPSWAAAAYPAYAGNEVYDKDEKGGEKPAVRIARNSSDERAALLKNGLDFFDESKMFGIGPGQYRFRHDYGRIKHNSFGNNGAHFWLVELISQFGLVVFVPYIFLFCWLGLKMLKSIKKDSNFVIYYVLAIIVFVIVSVMPSAFLILDINWIFTALLVVIAANTSSLTRAENDD
jgi:teichuronic acid biosynthesis protein TuaE